jgi:hypothetical protein
LLAIAKIDEDDFVTFFLLKSNHNKKIKKSIKFMTETPLLKGTDY